MCCTRNMHPLLHINTVDPTEVWHHAEGQGRQSPGLCFLRRIRKMKQEGISSTAKFQYPCMLNQWNHVVDWFAVLP